MSLYLNKGFMALALALSPAALGKDQGSPKKTPEFRLRSTAFADNDIIPKVYTGDGADQSPPLQWQGVPASARELVLICDDPDAPQPEPWVHWLVYRLPATTVYELKEGLKATGNVPWPKGALQGKNSWGHIGYQGPKPPPGSGFHHYRFKLIAVDQSLDLAPGVNRKDVEQALRGHIIGEAVLTGRYQR